MRKPTISQIVLKWARGS